MLGVVMAIEWTLAGHDLDFTAPWHWDWRVIGKAATRPDRVKGREVLLFGDSMLKFGVMPRVIGKFSGKTAYNFSLHMGQTPSCYFMLRRALRAGAKPSAIVLGPAPHMLTQPIEPAKGIWPELLEVGESLDLARTMGSSDAFAAITLARVLPSYKERYDIRANLMAALQGRSVSNRNVIPMYRRNWKVNDGAQLMGDVPRVVDVDFWTNTFFARWTPQAANVAYLDRFLELAASERIPVYWLVMPLYPEVQARTGASGFDAAYSAFIRDVHARFPGTIVVDARHAGFAPDLFADGVHLNRRGALKLSAALAEILRDPLEIGQTGHWVALDINRARPVDLPIEDLIQSSVAVETARATTRR
jgi:hypothetical protein